MMAIFNNRLFVSKGSPVVRFRKDESSSTGALTSVGLGPSDFHNGTQATSSWRLRDALFGTGTGTGGQVTTLSVSFQDTFGREDGALSQIGNTDFGTTTTDDEDQLATPINEVHFDVGMHHVDHWLYVG